MQDVKPTQRVTSPHIYDVLLLASKTQWSPQKGPYSHEVYMLTKAAGKHVTE